MGTPIMLEMFLVGDLLRTVGERLSTTLPLALNNATMLPPAVALNTVHQERFAISTRSADLPKGGLTILPSVLKVTLL